MSRSRLADIIISFLFVFAIFLLILRVGSQFIAKHAHDSTQSESFDIKDATSEDDKIMLGLWYEENGDLQNSYKVFTELYNTTKSKAYELKKIHLALMLNKDLPSTNKELTTFYRKNPNDRDVLKLLLTLHLMQNRFDLANKEASKLSKISDDYTDLEIASDAFLYSNEPNKALDLLKQIYDATGRDDVLLRMATIMSDMYKEHDKALDLLKSHISKYGDDKDVEHKIEEIQKAKQEQKDKI